MNEYIFYFYTQYIDYRIDDLYYNKTDVISFCVLMQYLMKCSGSHSWSWSHTGVKWVSLECVRSLNSPSRPPQSQHALLRNTLLYLKALTAYSPAADVWPTHGKIRYFKTVKKKACVYNFLITYCEDFHFWSLFGFKQRV